MKNFIFGVDFLTKIIIILIDSFKNTLKIMGFGKNDHYKIQKFFWSFIREELRGRRLTL